VANLFVVVELVGERPHPGSLEVLGQARRVGSALGATVYAVAPCAHAPGSGGDDLIDALSRHGADKVLLAVSPSHAGPMRWGSHGAAVLVACATMQPLLLLLADTHAARDLAPRLAARLGAAYLGDASVEIAGEGVALWDGAGEQARRLDGELDYTVVAAIPPGRYEPAHGDDEAEIELLETPPFPGPDFTELSEAPVDSAPRARVIGAGPAADELAAALGGIVGGSEREPVALAVTLDGGPIDERADVRVALGRGAGERACVHYAVDGDPDELARALARGVARRR